MTRRWIAWAGLLFLGLAATCASVASPKRVLILDPFGREVAPFATVVSSFKTTLAQALREPVDLYELPLDLARLSASEGEAALVTYLESRLKVQSIDLVVPVGAAGMQFAAKHRDRLFAKTPLLLLAPAPQVVTPALLGTNATLVTHEIDLPGMVEDILQLRPQTTNIVVVLGASALERFWAEECRREFQVFTNRVAFTWVNDWTLDRMLEHCAALPPHSFVLHALLIVDAAGVPCEKSGALVRLREVANAPLFGYFESEFGRGPIGGRLYQDLKVGAEAARTAVRILRGESAGSLPPQVLEPTVPVYDGRELRRWGVKEARLPAGSVIRFHEPGLWARYWLPVTGTLLFCLLQAGLIVGLLANRCKRAQAERALRDLSRRLIQAHEAERTRLARELHDDVTQRLARLAIDAGRAERGEEPAAATETLRSVRDGLSRLSEDIHALSYRLHPSVLEDLGLAEALRAECERFSRQESVRAEVKLLDLPPTLPADVALGLCRIAQEALRNVARHARASAVDVTLRAFDGGLQLAVRDNGTGFDPLRKREHLSLGLASMRERMGLLGGELDIESEPGHGTTVVAWVPLNEQKT